MVPRASAVGEQDPISNSHAICRAGKLCLLGGTEIFEQELLEGL